MNILIIGNGSTGVDQDYGMFINKHTGNFLNSLQANFKVSFCQFGVKYAKESDLSSYSLTDVGIDSIIFPSFKNPISIFVAISSILKSDFIYLFFPGNLSRLFGLLCFFMRKKFGIYLRGQYFSEYWFDSIILRNSSFILTVSPSFIDQLSDINNKVELIKPMIDISLQDFYSGDRNFDKEVIRFLTVGRVEERKGIIELLEIAKLLKDSGVKFIWDVVGGGDLIQESKENSHKMKLDSLVIFHGQVSEKEALERFYRDSDIFVFLSHDEGFPRVLYEAMAFKLPIFTTFVGGIPGRMVDDFNCFKLPLKNSKSAFEVLFSGLKRFCDLERISNEGQNTLREIINGKLISHEDLFMQKIINSQLNG